jgi:hypothetical protein
MGGHFVKALIFVAAFGVVLSGCAPIKNSDAQSTATTLSSGVSPSPKGQTAVEPGPWRIRKTEWTQADEDGFGQFVRAIAESDCTTTVSCIQSAANPYRDGDLPSFAIHADCAKWAYMLRAYYASKNGLPFSYVSRISSAASDPRFSAMSNGVAERRDIIDDGMAIDAASVLKHLHDEVSTATYRMDPTVQSPMSQDFYSPKIEPGAIRAGTIIYDINGHVMVVYDITPDGSILYMDANPDQTVTRGNYGPQVPRSEISLGGGFKNFRPLKLEGAQIQSDGTYVGGRIVLVANDAISDFSLEQYRGNVSGTKDDDLHAEFRYNDASLNFYEYTRASMSRGGFAFNPVYELEISMRELCHDAIDHTRGADGRIEEGVATLYADLSKTVTQRMQGDLRVVYNGVTLKDALTDAYSAQDQACVTAAGSGTSPLDRYMHQSPETDVQWLIAQIVEPDSFSQMRPVGH